MAGPDTRDDDALIEGLRAGDTGVFETLIRTYGTRLISVARRILNNDEDAREAVHEAFISAFRARQQFSGDSRLSTWLHRIVVNQALMKLRSKRRRPEDSIDDLVPRFLEDGRHAERFVSWDEPVDVALSRKETAAFVRAAIDRLPESYRTVLLLRDIEGLSNREAAEALDTTESAVKIRLHRARMALRALLAPEMGAVRT
ncbi:MAG TPA: sigma-70 family RNA polymerase sigma factor [Vicinamibacterales bacterium]|nr:sigma-70 family RNA polymerase sigma factor [Vicinamibacterales bacterium]